MTNENAGPDFISKNINIICEREREAAVLAVDRSVDAYFPVKVVWCENVVASIWVIGVTRYAPVRVWRFEEEALAKYRARAEVAATQGCRCCSALCDISFNEVGARGGLPAILRIAWTPRAVLSWLWTNHPFEAPVSWKHPFLCSKIPL